MLDARSWTTLELEGLLEDDESHVHFERAKRHLGLHPFHLTNLNAALREILGSALYSYDTKLQGIILSYKNPKLISRLGTLVYDTCFVHIDIEADFYVFRPSVGDSMKGIVNKKSQDHVGILVHKVFNVSILKPNNDHDWPGHSVEIGQEVRFAITCLDFRGKLPYIRGTMEALNYLEGCKPFEESFAASFDDGVKPKKTFSSFYDEENGEEVDNADKKMDERNGNQEIDEKVSSRKQKKLKREHAEDEISNVKRKKKEQKQEDESRLADNERKRGDEENDDSSAEFSPKKINKSQKENSEEKISVKKKKKKSKVKVEETSEDAGNIKEEYLPRKTKKFKRENDNDESIHDKYKTKPKLEVEITYADEEFDVAYKINENLKLKTERAAKRNNFEVEVRTSESDSDTGQMKHTKRAKNESSVERTKKRQKLKTEVLSSENENLDDVNENISDKYGIIKDQAISSDDSD